MASVSRGIDRKTKQNRERVERKDRVVPSLSFQVKRGTRAKRALKSKIIF